MKIINPSCQLEKTGREKKKCFNIKFMDEVKFTEWQMQ